MSQPHQGPCRKRKPGGGSGCGEAQSRRSRRARQRAPHGGVLAARVRGRLGAGRYLPDPASVYQQTAGAGQRRIPTC